MLPRPPTPFSGREAALSALDAHLSQTPLLVLKGLRGIGKTALALHCLERHRPSREVHYVAFQPQLGLLPLFQELDATPQAHDIAHQTREWLRLCHAPALNTSHPLWALDDVNHLSQADLATLVRVLQAHLRFSVILLSHQELPLSPLELVDIAQYKLSGLAFESGIELLQRLTKGSEDGLAPETARQLVQESQGHPLMLRLLAVAGTMGQGSIREFLASEILQHLHPNACWLLQALSLCRQGLSDQGLSLLPESGELASLSSRFLVERLGAGWKVPPLIAEYLPEFEADSVHHRLREVFEQLDQPEEALYHSCFVRDQSDLASRLEPLAPVLCARGQYEFLEEVVNRVKRQMGVVSPCLALAFAYALDNQGRWEDCYAMLKALFEDPNWKAAAANAWGGALLNRGEWAGALEQYEGVLQDPTASPSTLVKALHYRVLLLAFSGQAGRARKLLEQRGQELVGDTFHRFRIDSVLAHFEGRPEQAFESARKAVALAQVKGGNRQIALALQALSEALCDLGRPDAARPEIAKALDCARRSGERQIIGICLLSLARIAELEGEELEASQLLLDTELLFMEVGNFNYASEARTRILSMQSRRGSWDEAAFQRCLETAQRCGNGLLERRLQDLTASRPSALVSPRSEEPATEKDGLCICLLGDFRLQQGQQILLESDWPTRKSASLMALLCLHWERGLTDERLLGLFWPDSPQEQARSSLRSALYQIRKTLKAVVGEDTPDLVSRNRKTGLIRLNQRPWLDFEEFRAALPRARESYLAQDFAQTSRHLEKALELYRGDFAENFQDLWTDLPRHEHSKELPELYLLLCHSERAQKRYGAAEIAARKGLQQEPFAEELHLALMEVLLAQGRKAEALRHYRQALAELESELGHYPRCFDDIFARIII